MITTIMAAIAITSAVAAVSQLPGDIILMENRTEVIASDGNDGSSLADTHTKVVAAGTIPDDYLIDRTGDKWVAHYTTPDTANDRMQWTRTFLSTATDGKVDQLSDRLSMREINFVTLSENPDIDLDEVAALQIQHMKLSGSYTTPTEEPVSKYHAYILGQYNLPGTIGEVTAKLDTMTGNLTSFADDILDTRNTWAQRGIIPLGLDADNEHYWAAVGALFDCQHEGIKDCAEYREFLENEAWNDDDGEFIPPPGQE